MSLPLAMGASPMYIRFLSFQLTGHIVWASVEPVVSNMGPKRVPNCCPDLDYGTYAGPGPIDMNQFWREHKQYRLTASVTETPVTIGIEELPSEFVAEVKLARAQCYATQLINGSVNWALEKNGLYDNPIMDPGITVDQLAEIYQRRQAISAADARKLVEFKQSEHCSKISYLRSVQVDAELAVINARTVEDVVAVYNATMKSLAALRASETNLTRFL